MLPQTLPLELDETDALDDELDDEDELEEDEEEDDVVDVELDVELEDVALPAPPAPPEPAELPNTSATSGAEHAVKPIVRAAPSTAARKRLETGMVIRLPGVAETILARLMWPVRLSLLMLVAAMSGCRTQDPPTARTFAYATVDSPAAPAPSSALAPAVTQPPACEEITPDTGPGHHAIAGPWPRAAAGADGLPRAVRADKGQMGRFEQRFEDPGAIDDRGRAQPAVVSGQRGATPLRFLGAHLFDLLQKVAYEGGSTELERRRLICAALNAAAARGAPVLRIWGTLKQTGSPGEITHAADTLELVLDENARRARPVRFIIALMNHQAGYGSPRPDASLDDQDPKSPWHASQIYRGGSWRREGAGLLGDRIAHYQSRAAIRSSPYVLAWELVNELDTHRSVAGGSFSGPEAAALRETFITPAMTLLANGFPQPVAVGDLRGALGKGQYLDFVRSVVAALPEQVRGRLAWTSHVYTMLDPKGGAESDRRERARATAKLDVDLAFAAEAGLPFFVGELGQHVKGAEARFCTDGPRHDIEALFGTVFEPTPDGPLRGAIDAAVFWGEGECHLEVRGGEQERVVRIGAGGDSADLGPNEIAARAAVKAARARARFRVAP